MTSFFLANTSVRHLSALLSSLLVPGKVACRNRLRRGKIVLGVDVYRWKGTFVAPGFTVNPFSNAHEIFRNVLALIFHLFVK